MPVCYPPRFQHYYGMSSTTKILPQLYYPKTRAKPWPTSNQIRHDPLRLIVTKHQYYALKNTDKKTPSQIKKRTLKKVQTRWHFNYSNQRQHTIGNIRLTIEHQKLPLQILFATNIYETINRHYRYCNFVGNPTSHYQGTFINSHCRDIALSVTNNI